MFLCKKAKMAFCSPVFLRSMLLYEETHVFVPKDVGGWIYHGCTINDYSICLQCKVSGRILPEWQHGTSGESVNLTFGTRAAGFHVESLVSHAVLPSTRQTDLKRAVSHPWAPWLLSWVEVCCSSWWCSRSSIFNLYEKFSCVKTSVKEAHRSLQFCRNGSLTCRRQNVTSLLALYLLDDVTTPSILW